MRYFGTSTQFSKIFTYKITYQLNEYVFYNVFMNMNELAYCLFQTLLSLPLKSCLNLALNVLSKRLPCDTKSHVTFLFWHGQVTHFLTKFKIVFFLKIAMLKKLHKSKTTSFYCCLKYVTVLRIAKKNC